MKHKKMDKLKAIKVPQTDEPLPEAPHARYFKRKYQMTALMRDTHLRIVYHSRKKDMMIKDYVDSLIPEIPDEER